MKKTIKPYFSAAIKKIGSPEKLGLPSQKTIMKSAYMSKCGKKKQIMVKKFKKHNMYSKSGVSKVAKTLKEHLLLKKKGYTHTPPKKKKYYA